MQSIKSHFIMLHFIICIENLKKMLFKKGNRDRKSKNYANKLTIKKLKTRWNSIVVIEQKVDYEALFGCYRVDCKGRCSQNRDSKCFRINFLLYNKN